MDGIFQGVSNLFQSDFVQYGLSAMQQQKEIENTHELEQIRLANANKKAQIQADSKVNLANATNTNLMITGGVIVAAIIVYNMVK